MVLAAVTAVMVQMAASQLTGPQPVTVANPNEIAAAIVKALADQTAGSNASVAGEIPVPVPKLKPQRIAPVPHLKPDAEALSGLDKPEEEKSGGGSDSAEASADRQDSESPPSVVPE